VDDPQSTSALLGYASAVIFAWLFARTERALSLRSQSSLERLVEQVRPLGHRLLGKSTNKRRLVLATGLGHVVAGLVAVAVVFLEAQRWIDQGLASRIPAFLVAGVLSLLPLVFVHSIIPSTNSHEEFETRKVRLLAPLLVLWAVVCWPFVWPLDRLIAHLARQPEGKEAREEALMALVEDDSEEGIIEAEKREMISSIMNIDETTVKEVMVPRVDIVAIERSALVGELLRMFAETQHSRIPIYDTRIDNIMGIVHAKDVLRAIQSESYRDGTLDETTVDHFVKEGSVVYVPITKKIDELLRELRREKKHMAIAVDEYGGTAGLITMEDILEEIVGEIQDEYDEEEEFPYRWLSERQVEVDASMDIADVNELIGGDLPDENGYETLGGFLYHQFSAVPEPGAETEYEAFRFVVRSTSAQRIDKVLIEKMPDESESSSET